MKDEIMRCDECKSEYFRHSSKMEALCPEGAYLLYGYKNCKHHFQNQRCLHCYWDGSQSEYIRSMN